MGIAMSKSQEMQPEYSEGEPPAEPVAEIHSGTLRWLVDDDHPARTCGQADLFLRAAQPPSAARFSVGERVEWTNMLQNTFVGSVRKVATENRYVVQFDDGTVGERVESELRPVLTKPDEQP
jgi:hypothetical protein